MLQCVAVNILQLYLFNFFAFWLLLQLNDCDWVRLAGPLDESFTPHLPHTWFDKQIQFQQNRCFLDIRFWCHLVVPQILGRLLCGALGVPHQAALFIVHLIKKFQFSPHNIAWVFQTLSNQTKSTRSRKRVKEGNVWQVDLLADLLAPGLTFALRPVPAHLLLVQNSFQNILA